MIFQFLACQCKLLYTLRRPEGIKICVRSVVPRQSWLTTARHFRVLYANTTVNPRASWQFCRICDTQSQRQRQDGLKSSVIIMFAVLCIKTFLCGLFNDAVINPDYITSMVGCLVNDKFKRTSWETSWLNQCAAKIFAWIVKQNRSKSWYKTELCGNSNPLSP
jgi:hypothetical protein